MWQPISREEFEETLKQQENDLTGVSRRAYRQFRVPLRTAIIRRSDMMGDEKVFVVASSPRGVLYFDDVEEGFNISPLDEYGRIKKPGGSQMDLSDAVLSWLVPQLGRADESEGGSEEMSR